MLIHAPISLGELFDKITILELKKEHAADEQKLTNIRFELDELRKLRPPISIRLGQLIVELKDTNRILWDAEDQIRVLMRRDDYGPEFTEATRLAHNTNDLRNRIKREINNITGSAIVEEKLYY
jgi:hypothetical protein